jgi:hypothetical protein
MHDCFRFSVNNDKYNVGLTNRHIQMIKGNNKANCPTSKATKKCIFYFAQAV